MRWRSRLLTGDAEIYDGTNADAIETFAGDDWRGVGGNGHPVVRSADGGEVTLKPGWAVTRADGEDGIVVNSTGAHARWCEQVP